VPLSPLLSLHDALPILVALFLAQCCGDAGTLYCDATLGTFAPGFFSIAPVGFLVSGTAARCGIAWRSIDAHARGLDFSSPVSPRSEEHTSELQSRFDLV